MPVRKAHYDDDRHSSPRGHRLTPAVASLVPIAAVRSVGALRLGFRRVGEATRLHDAYQQGCARARLPRVDPASRTEAVLINTSGGLTGGDRVEQHLHWDDRTVATVTTQAAEKIYRVIVEPATIASRITIGAGADAEWLPQETILFDGAALDRSLDVEMAADARLLVVEALLFGRRAMDETMKRGSLVDRWKIRRDGRLIYADAFTLSDAPAAALARPAVADGAAATATLLLVAPDAERGLADLRAVLKDAPGRLAASAWNGMLAARFLAPDGETLRRALLPALACLRGGRPLPRVWSC